MNFLTSLFTTDLYGYNKKRYILCVVYFVHIFCVFCALVVHLVQLNTVCKISRDKFAGP